MKNYMDQFRMTVVAGTDDYTSSKTLTAATDLKMIKGKLSNLIKGKVNCSYKIKTAK